MWKRFKPNKLLINKINGEDCRRWRSNRFTRGTCGLSSHQPCIPPQKEMEWTIFGYPIILIGSSCLRTRTHIHTYTIIIWKTIYDSIVSNYYWLLHWRRLPEFNFFSALTWMSKWIIVMCYFRCLMERWIYFIWVDEFLMTFVSNSSLFLFKRPQTKTEFIYKLYLYLVEMLCYNTSMRKATGDRRPIRKGKLIAAATIAMTDAASVSVSICTSIA